MASHTKSELRWAAGVLARAIRAAAPRAVPVAPAEAAPAPVVASGVFDGLSEAA
jgi:hypothetical protein